jgi:hypothetical protein
VAIFVINEWLWHDSAGENGLDLQRQAYDVIRKLAASDHRIVIIGGSSFDIKAWKICTSTDTIVRVIARAYVVNLRQNSDRCLILKPEQVGALPEDLFTSTKADDHYLLLAQLAVPGAILITTDNPLREAVLRAGLSCLSRDEFVANYFGR